MPVENRKKSSISADSLKNIIDKQSKSAEVDEPAWKVLGEEPALYIWWIENFKPVLMQKSQHGLFYDGDTYIVLNAYLTKSKKLAYDAFLWIGNYSTADEYGTGAYKMAELDLQVLNDAAVQHREVQGCESLKFLDLFTRINIRKGGVTSGFKTVESGKPEPKLLHISGQKKNVRVQEISYSKDNITADDVFIVDLGDEIYIINGQNCSKDEKFRGVSVSSGIKSERPKVMSEIIDDYAPGVSHPIIDSMPSGNKEDIIKKTKENRPLSLWKLSDASGKMEMVQVSSGKCQKSSLDGKDVFILDGDDKIFVWVGKDTTRGEKFHALAFAQKYAETVNEPKIPLIKVSQGGEPEDMMSLLA